MFYEKDICDSIISKKPKNCTLEFYATYNWEDTTKRQKRDYKMKFKFLNDSVFSQKVYNSKYFFLIRDNEILSYDIKNDIIYDLYKYNEKYDSLEYEIKVLYYKVGKDSTKYYIATKKDEVITILNDTKYYTFYYDRDSTVTFSYEIKDSIEELISKSTSKFEIINDSTYIEKSERINYKEEKYNSPYFTKTTFFYNELNQIIRINKISYVENEIFFDWKGVLKIKYNNSP